MPELSSKLTKAARAPMTLDVLVKTGGSARRAETWDVVAEAYPPTGADLEVVSNGMPRGMNDWLWSTTFFVKAGWMTKDRNGTWTITNAGRGALATYADPLEFTDAARAGYANWDKQRKEVLATRLLPRDDQQKRVIQAAEIFSERALGNSESVFAPGRTIWVPEIIDEAHAAFVGAGAGVPAAVDEVAECPWIAEIPRAPRRQAAPRPMRSSPAQ
jgi:hypothetical protein